MDCNRDYAVQIDDAFGAKDKQKNAVLSILYCQVKRVSTRLLINNYKTYFLKQTSPTVFTLEEVEE